MFCSSITVCEVLHLSTQQFVKEPFPALPVFSWTAIFQLRVFSTAGQTLDDCQSQLNPEAVDHLLFLHGLPELRKQ